MLLLACESVACPVFSIGIDVPSGCSCSRGRADKIMGHGHSRWVPKGWMLPTGCWVSVGGLHGEIVAEAWVPFYSGNCGEAANTVTGPPCSKHSYFGIALSVQSGIPKSRQEVIAHPHATQSPRVRIPA